MIPRRRETTYPGMAMDILDSLLTRQALYGEFIERFEDEIARKMGVGHAIAVSSGRFGMRMILENLGLDGGDEIILPAYTQVELPAVVAAAGFTPVMADVAPGNVNCSAVQIDEKITTKTRVVMMTHMTGEAADVEGILALAARRRLIVVEDNAHGLGVQAPDGRFLGGLARAGFLSLETRKLVNTLGGGMVVTSDDDLARAIRTAVAPLQPVMSKLLKRLVSVSLEELSLSAPLAPIVTRALHSQFLNEAMIRLYRKVHRSNRDVRVGYSNLQARLGFAQMRSLDRTIRHRNELGRTYIQRLLAVSERILDHAYLSRLKALVESDALVRDNFYAMIVFGHDTPMIARKLVAMGIDVGVREDTCEDLPARYDPHGSYPNTAHAIRQAIQLPIYSGMTTAGVHKVCDAFEKLQ